MSISPASLRKQLQGLGYEVKEGDPSLLVPVDPKGALMCVDGRLGDGSEEVMSGPKLQGGILGVMALGGLSSSEAIMRAKEAGFKPGIHSDDHHGEMGCGFGKLWLNRAFERINPPQESLAEITQAVVEAGGSSVVLEGAHAEKTVRINLQEGMTLVPDGTAFILDLWPAQALGLDSQVVAENALDTVKKLNGPNVIEIF